MTYIKSIEINQFRGIAQLTISGFSNINLIVGDNNSGKTSFLEAIQLLFSGSQLGMIKNVIRQRTVLKPDHDSFYTSFIRTFNKRQSRDQLGFSISADSSSGNMEFEMRGQEKKVSGENALQMAAMTSRQKALYKSQAVFLPESVRLFQGSIISRRDGKKSEKKIQCTSLDNDITGIQLRKEAYYLPSFGHLRYDLLQNIVDNPAYKKLTIDILKQFDSDIMDICYTRADDGTYLETIITADGVNMPFSAYGDGIKKILYIINKIFEAENSILMIDEIETGLHKKYYELLFPVIFALANKLNVQLFIATHSIEAIDAILKYGNYDNDTEGYDPIRVITLKKVQSDRNSSIAARNVSGKYVYDNRKVFEFEVRL